jgi:hypothetical protein
MITYLPAVMDLKKNMRNVLYRMFYGLADIVLGNDGRAMRAPTVVRHTPLTDKQVMRYFELPKPPEVISANI